MGKAKLSTSISKVKPRGRPPKQVRYIYVKRDMDYVKKVEELNLSGNIAENWRIFWQNFKIFAVAVELDKKPEPVKVAIFLNAIGAEAVEVFNSLNISEAGRANYCEVTKAFEEFCKPKCNEVYESFNFHNRSQAHGEPFDTFLIDVKKMVRRCGFQNENRMVRDRIVLGTNDKKLQKKLLDTMNLTMEMAIDMARTAEVTNQQMTKMQKGEATVDLVCKQTGNNENIRFSQKTPKSTQKQVMSGNHKMKKDILNCTFCGRTHSKGKCPAFGKSCNNCKGRNHFAEVCRKKSVGELKLKNNNLNDSYLYLDSIGNVNGAKMWYEKIKIQEQFINFKLDTGAMVNILPFSYMKGFKNVQINKSNENLIAYNGSKIKNLGFVNLRCQLKDKLETIKCFIVGNEINSVPILGLETCVSLGLIKRVDCINKLTKEVMLNKYQHLFEGIGCFKRNFSIELKENVVPCSKPAARIPLALREPLKLELMNLCGKDIIEKCETPSSWVSNIVIVEKPNKKLRICINPKELNMAIKDHYYEIPTFEQIKTNLINKKFFSVFDLKEGFWQIALSEKSKEFCTFSTPFGCYRFKRLPFGIKIAPEVFQKLNEENFGDIKNITVYIDDILIAAETEQEHDNALKRLLERASERNIKFNRDKIQWKQKEVVFLGHRISEEGIECDKNRLKGIQNLGAPKCKKDLQRLMGFINYLREYIPNLSDISSPIRELMKNSVIFEWLPTHEKCLDKIKNMILNAPTLKPFDMRKKIYLQTDASKSGLGCALLQNKRPVCFASRSLNDAETRYAQIEKEMLAVVFACQKFHNYIYGQKVEIITDHKPLLGVIKKDYNKVPSAKLQRMKLKLEKYDLNFTYLPGKFLYVADWLSRSFSKNIEKEDEIKGLEEMVHTVNVSEGKKKKIKEETAKDTVLKTISEYIKHGWPKDRNKLNEDMRCLWKHRMNFFIEEDLVFLDDRIFIPQSLREMVLEHLHKSHMGIEKTKNRARQLVFWPNMNQEIENMITKCRTCQKYRSANIKEPLLNHVIPNAPYERLAMDVMEVHRRNFLIVGDYFSKYLDIIPLTTKTAKAISEKLDIVFSVHGYPLEIVADNVPFGSFEFKQWANDLDIQITTTSPLYPKSNGFAERMVQIAKKLVLKCNEENSNLWHALLEYRNTPIKNSELSPAQLLMGRQTRTLLPGKTKFFNNAELSRKIIPILNHNNECNKRYHDKNSKARKEFEKGEKVWMKDKKVWVPGRILDKHGSPRSYIIATGGKTFRRNSFFLRNRK